MSFVCYSSSITLLNYSYGFYLVQFIVSVCLQPTAWPPIFPPRVVSQLSADSLSPPPSPLVTPRLLDFPIMEVEPFLTRRERYRRQAVWARDYLLKFTDLVRDAEGWCMVRREYVMDNPVYKTSRIYDVTLGRREYIRNFPPSRHMSIPVITTELLDDVQFNDAGGYFHGEPARFEIKEVREFRQGRQKKRWVIKTKYLLEGFYTLFKSDAVIPILD